jgi:hypothetical protein
VYGKTRLSEILAKRLGLLHEMVPQGVRVAVLLNPANNPTAEATLQLIPEAARALGPSQIGTVSGAGWGKDHGDLSRMRVDALNLSILAPEVILASG